MSIPTFDAIIEPNDQTKARQASLDALRVLVGNVYPNKFTRSKLSGTEDTITNLKVYEPVVEIVNEIKAVVATLADRERPPAEIKDALNTRLREFGNVRISGRLTTPPRGNFVHLTDGINKLQVYCNKKGPLALVINDGNDSLDEGKGWEAWQLLDHGDFIGVEGYLFITNTGELSVHVEKLQFLAKAIQPMPDKMHGIADPELQRRFRYADLIASTLQVEHEGLTTREVFERRAKLISGMRRFLDDAGFIEVETPMLTPKATGAAAKPFETHHNALDIPLYARVAPELYLKRLVVGGFERVYELNRNFRNEGLSQRHNPEFTMLEFYIAYMDVNGMMDFAEKFLRDAVKNAFGKHTVRIKAGQLRSLYFGQKNVDPVSVDITVGHVSRSTTEPLRSINSIVVGKEPINVSNNEISFENFHRITMKEAVIQHSSLAHSLIGEDVSEWLDKGANVHSLSEFLWWVDNELSNEIMIMDDHGDIVGQLPDDQVNQIIETSWRSIILKNKDSVLTAKEIAMGLISLFEDVVEERLIQPTFITDYPKIISPLSKADPSDPNIAERFELFINGMEVANGFSELNDPKEQYDRFIDQMSERERGDEEAMVLDEDYIRALSYGMPPAAGIGIGIDRLVMLLTNKHSIRDVILFPHMRPEKRKGEGEEI